MVLIIAAALAVPWVKMNGMVDDAELEVSRQMVATWEHAAVRTGLPGAAGARSRGEDQGAVPTGGPGGTERPARGGRSAGSEGGIDQEALLNAARGGAPESEPSPIDLRSHLPVLAANQRLFAGNAELRVLGAEQVEGAASGSEFVRSAWDAVRTAGADGARTEEFAEASWRFTERQYHYAKAIRTPRGALEGLVVLERTSLSAARGMVRNTLYLFAAGCVALGFAVLVFYLVTNRLILSPVRQLRETAEEVREGNLDVRSQIQTHDEFEDLAEAFNEMLTSLQSQQKQLRAINASLDDKLSELSERNSALAEAAKLKGEFLANVTHELRTPLNSVIGFAELLDEGLAREGAGEGPEGVARVAKRRRYLENILGSGRTLLDLINSLLEMAKVEAGKSELVIKPVDVGEKCEQLAALMKPMADKRTVELRLEIAPDLPRIDTDARKLQQIVFNLLSNAVKFTADAAEAEREAATVREMNGEAPGEVRQALVTLRAEPLVPRGGGAEEGRVRISVLDTGPGINREDLGKIFEKFTQLDTGYARKHAGTGLGLAICKELTHLLQGEMMVQSEVGHGSMFSVILPLALDPARAAEGRLEQEFRGALAGPRGA